MYFSAKIHGDGIIHKPDTKLVKKTRLSFLPDSGPPSPARHKGSTKRPRSGKSTSLRDGTSVQSTPVSAAKPLSTYTRAQIESMSLEEAEALLNKTTVNVSPVHSPAKRKAVKRSTRSPSSSTDRSISPRYHRSKGKGKKKKSSTSARTSRKEDFDRKSPAENYSYTATDDFSYNPEHNTHGSYTKQSSDTKLITDHKLDPYLLDIQTADTQTRHSQAHPSKLHTSQHTLVRNMGSDSNIHTSQHTLVSDPRSVSQPLQHNFSSVPISKPPQVGMEGSFQDTSYLGYQHEDNYTQDYYSQSQTDYFDQYGYDYTYDNLETANTVHGFTSAASATATVSRDPQGSYSTWESLQPLHIQHMDWPASDQTLHQGQLEALPIPVITSYTGEKFISTGEKFIGGPSVETKKVKPLFPHLPTNLGTTSLEGKNKFDMRQDAPEGASSDEDIPMIKTPAHKQSANLHVPPEFLQLFEEIIKLEGLKSDSVISDMLPSGQVIYRLPSASKEIDQYFQCHEVSAQMDTQSTFDCYPQQPEFIHRIHTDTHVGSSNDNSVSQAKLSSVPWQFGDLRMGPSVSGAPKRQRIRWPVHVQRSVESSSQHVLDLVRHQDLYNTVAATSLQETLDRVEMCKSNNIPVTPETLQAMSDDITHSLQALHNSINLQSAVFSHQTFSLSCMELSRRHRFLSQTTFIPQVDSGQVRQLALHSPVGTAHLISPLQCTALKFVSPRTSVVLQDPRSNLVETNQDAQSQISQMDISSTTKSIKTQSVDISHTITQEITHEINNNNGEPQIQDVQITDTAHNQVSAQDSESDLLASVLNTSAEIVTEGLQDITTPLMDESTSPVVSSELSQENIVSTF